ncbi:hypothetical protein K501DRAFT_277222 [Backusella circina FSU 941]|nr:hypothetical protein K501DRAFT_277222 [Backusella circina FSU 941]
MTPKQMKKNRMFFELLRLLNVPAMYSLPNDIYHLWLFWVILIVDIVVIILVGLFVQETLRPIVGDVSGYYNPIPFRGLAQRRGKLNEQLIERIREKRNSPKLDFFRLSCIYWSLMSLFNINNNHFAIHYRLSKAQIDLCFLASGFGTIITLVLEGRLLDRDYRIIQFTLNPFCYHTVIYACLRIVLCCECSLCYYVGSSISCALATLCIDPVIGSLGSGWMFTVVGLILVVSNVLSGKEVEQRDSFNYNDNNSPKFIYA